MKSFVLLFFLISYCVGNAQSTKDKLIGVWAFHKTHSIEKEIIVSYKKVDSLGEETGFEFRTENTLIVRNLAGYCATPPWTFESRKGTWQQKEASTITLEYSDWRGKKEREITILSLNDSIVKLKWLPEKK